MIDIPDPTRFTIGTHFVSRPASWKVELRRSKMGHVVLEIGDLNMFVSDAQVKELAWEIDAFFSKESENAIQP